MVPNTALSLILLGAAGGFFSFAQGASVPLRAICGAPVKHLTPAMVPRKTNGAQFRRIDGSRP